MQPRRVSSLTATFIALAATAWVGTVVWALAMDMGAEAGTMGLGAAGFIGLWTLMMAAMMLPSVATLASLYAKSVRQDRFAVASFGAGYVLAWALT